MAKKMPPKKSKPPRPMAGKPGKTQGGKKC